MIWLNFTLVFNISYGVPGALIFREYLILQQVVNHRFTLLFLGKAVNLLMSIPSIHILPAALQVDLYPPKG